MPVDSIGEKEVLGVILSKEANLSSVVSSAGRYSGRSYGSDRIRQDIIMMVVVWMASGLPSPTVVACFLRFFSL